MSTELTELLRAGMERVPARVSPGLAEQAYRRYRRRRARTRAAAVTGTVAVTGAVALAATGNLSGGSAPGGTPAQTVAYVVDRTARALDASESTLMRISTHTVGAERAKEWTLDGRTRTEIFSLSGQPLYDNSLLFTSGSHTVVNVDFRKGTWYRLTADNPPWASHNPTFEYSAGTDKYTISVSPSCGNPPGGLSASAESMAAQLREWVTCRALKTGQVSEIDGVRAIPLIGSFDHYIVTYWVDVSSYLPVRMTLGFQHSPPSRLSQWDMQWVHPTPANLANLTVPIPPGFTQVRPPS